MAEKQVDPEFGRRLRELREAKGFTLAQVGEAAGIGYQEVSRYERAAREPKWYTVKKLAAALGVTPDAFLAPAPKAARRPRGK